MKVKFMLNGVEKTVENIESQTLFNYLRDNEFKSVKYGCDDGRCGSCAVLIDGKSINSCLVLMHTIDKKIIETVEYFAKDNKLHHMQENFIDKGAIQCGYCTPGMLISLEALERENQNTNEDDIRDSLAGNLCRCTGYVKPVEAAKK
jgi:aerobic-type carbon monoxide dehydrogenase small subunit (CoxS/CutS family)